MSSKASSIANLAENAVISVRDVSKTYRMYKAPSDRLWQAYWRHSKKLYQEVWAVKDVSFELDKGCAMGIVGSNGAGKSTLLQMVAGTLLPTHGEILTRGRVLALLELGSSFNPAFSGRENIYFYGAALGLEYEDLHSRYDDIVAFSELEDYVDQPIKTYSSGMVMRLAFSVQAHIEPTVLIVDEALSVGDMHFQMKCMRHINRLMDKGVSLLFVSHSPDTVKQLCDRAIWLEHGEVQAFGESAQVVEAYLEQVRMKHTSTLQKVEGAEKDTVEDNSSSAETQTQLKFSEVNWENLPLLDQYDASGEGIFLSEGWERRSIQLGDKDYQAYFSFQPGTTLAFRCKGFHISLAFLRHPLERDSANQH